MSADVTAPEQLTITTASQGNGAGPPLNTVLIIMMNLEFVSLPPPLQPAPANIEHGHGGA